MTVRTISAIALSLVLMGPGWQASAGEPGPRYYAEQYLDGRGATDYTLTAVTDDYVAATFPGLSFFEVVFEQYPHAVQPPAGLNTSDVLVVHADQVFPLTGPDVMHDFFLGWVGPVPDTNAALAVGGTWMRLTEVYSQDGFFTFSEPIVRLVNVDVGPLVVMGEVDVIQGGTGSIKALLSFDGNGQLTDVQESRDVQPGSRPLGP